MNGARINDIRCGFSFVISALTLLAGCMSTPARYQLPQETHQPRIDRLSISGFRRTEFFETGGSNAYVGGNGVSGGASSWQGEYHEVSDASAFRQLLENTRCARRVVDEGEEAPLRLEGEASTQRRLGPVRGLVRVVEWSTLLPFLGIPMPGAIDASGTVRLYRDGEYVKSLSASARLSYWTTAYSNGEPLHGTARGMVLRDLADNVAADLCGRAPEIVSRRQVNP